jgi:hypothetical protein
VLVAVGVALVLVVLLAAGAAWGRPHVTWAFQITGNRLTVNLVGGRGPLAGWLLSHASLHVGPHAGRRRVVLTLVPGKTTRLVAQATSVWTSAKPIIVRVPPAPALTSTAVGTTAVQLRFSLPVTTVTTPCGVARSPAPTADLAVPRAAAACSGTLTVAASSGERTSMTLFIPALPPPPPPTPPPLPPSTPAPVTYFGPSAGGVFYITIDDGTYPDPGVLGLMQQAHIPITAFLVSSVAADHLDYWRAFLAAGGDIEDHTVSHPDLTKLAPTATEAQWSEAAQALHQWFGITPTLGRPPYGALNPTVQLAASQAGLRTVVMWIASMYNGQLSTYDHRPLRAGEIVILHWIPGLYNSLVQLLALASAQGLHPAPLAAALAQSG